MMHEGNLITIDKVIEAANMPNLGYKLRPLVPSMDHTSHCFLLLYSLTSQTNLATLSWLFRLITSLKIIIKLIKIGTSILNVNKLFH